MPRRGKIERRETIPDAIYGSVLAAKFMNCVMRDGKKSVAQQIFYGAMEILGEKTGEEPIQVFKKAVENAKPNLEVKSRRVGGSTYQVPIEVNPRRRESLALRWLIGFAQKRSEKTMRERLAMELLDAANERGATIRRREEVHRMAEANRAFAHYRW
jgi:small subunit ribosomal protein S7